MVVRGMETVIIPELNLLLFLQLKLLKPVPHRYSIDSSALKRWSRDEIYH